VQALTGLAVVILAGLALVTLQVLIGGVKLVYSLPAYAVLGLAGLATLGGIRRQPSARPIAACLATAALLGGYILWRSWNSPVDYLARTDFSMMLGAILVYALTAISVVSPKFRIGLLWSVFGVAVVHAVISVVQFKEKQNFMLLPWIFRSDYGYRGSGFYICPNHLAGLLEMIALLAVSVAIWGRGRPWVRILAGWVALSSVVGLAVTGSRGGYLSFVSGLAVLVLLTIVVIHQVKRRWFWRTTFFALLGFSLVVGGAVVAMRKSADLERRLGQVWDPSNMRLYMWEAALKAYELNPITGVGSGTYLYYGRHFRSHTVQNDPQHVHNDYLELLTEYGWLGCALFSTFFIAHLAAGFLGVVGVVRSRLRPMHATRSNELALLVGTLAALAALAVHSVIDFNLHIPANTLFCAFLFGLLANPRSPVGEEFLHGRIEGLWLRLVPPVVGAGLVVFAAPRIRGEYYGERARMALRDQMNPEAAHYAEQALARDQRNPNFYYYLGEAKHNLAMLERDPEKQYKLHTEAARLFAAGLQQFPSDLQLLLKLGRTLDNLKRFEEAEGVFQLAVNADPNFCNVYAYYGFHCFLQHRLIRAERLYRRAIELGDTTIAPLGLKDIVLYRERAAEEATAENYPVEDQPEDEFWVPKIP